uniref:Tyrosine-protein phosphatase non-receptor type n=1 Tax=Sarcophilus harrisii TaxID=9305 RepID=G3W834_SARHA
MLTGYGVVTRAVVAIERELHGLDISNGWPQAFLEMADLCHDYPYRAARAWENRARNRYRDVSPYDHSRVHLMVNNDYINANFVVVEEAQRRYILTQGPLPNTSGHFWLMVWQQNSRGVIMLNRLVEKETVKCSQYWPLCQGQVVFFEEVGISVQMLGEEVKPYYEVHYLRLENMMTGESKAVSHFHYTSWPDFGVPESPASFLAFLFMVRESGSLNDEQSTVVIHCSAGIGRSGTFALIDSCLVLLEKRENRFSLNIRQALVNLRKYRMGLIQTPEQLRFSYVAIVEGAKYLMGDQSIRKKWKALTQEDHCRSYSFDSSPPPSGITKKYDDESDYSDLATRMPDSGEESCETTTRKRSREESKGDSSQEEGHKKDKKSKVPSKRKKPNPPDL